MNGKNTLKPLELTLINENYTFALNSKDINSTNNAL